MEYRIGIDPGITGAMALLEYNGEWPTLVEVTDMPVMTLTGKKQQVNAVEVANKLRHWLESPIFTTTQYPVVFLEHVQAMPDQGTVSMFNFGMGFGMLQGVVAAMKLPMVLVRPNIWKKRAALLHTEKDAARTKAQQMFPKADLGRKKDIGRADAILIAVFGK